MLKQDVRTELERVPFAPVRIHLTDGRRFDVPFREVARLMGQDLLILIGLEPGTFQAKAYDTFPYDYIDRIEPLPKARRRKRAS